MDAGVEGAVDLLEGDVLEVGRARQRERAEGFLGLAAAAAPNTRFCTALS